MADNVIVRVPEQQFIRGEDGYSPVVTIEDIEHGHRVTITDREHPVEGQSFDVMDGASAYEQAADGGYSGTEAEFNEELANFKEYAQQANYARSDAITAANTAGIYSSQARLAVNQAQSAMNAAQRAATQANSSATAAADSAAAAGNAQTAAETARDAAASSATDAAGSATTATQQAQAAATERAAAETAQNAAETAQGAAEAAQQAIEDLTVSAQEIDTAGPTVEKQVDPQTGAVNLNFGFAKNQATTATTLGPAPIVTFDASAADMPLKGLTVDIEPVQSGTGDPSPDNVRPISGWTGCNVTRTGKNLLNQAGTDVANGYVFNRYLNASGDLSTPSTSRWDVLEYVKVEPNTTYTLSGTHPSASNGYVEYDQNKNMVLHGTVTQEPFTFKTTANSYYIRVNKAVTDNIDMQLEKGSLATNYEPFGIVVPVSWESEAGTVYGGTLDVVNGKLTVTYEIHILNDLAANSAAKSGSSLLQPGRCGYYLRAGTNVNSWLTNSKYTGGDTNPNKVMFYSDVYNIGMKSSLEVAAFTAFGIGLGSYGGFTTLWFNVSEVDCPDADSFITYMNAMSPTICYELATPIEIPLTSIPEITTLLGTNNIWADCGDVTVTYGAYLETVKAHAELLGDSILSAIAPLETTYTASRNYSVGSYLFVGTRFYKVTQAIAEGGTITPETNVTQTTVAEQLINLARYALQIVITKQPEDASAALGKYVTVTVEAWGENLSYQWYYKTVNDTEFNVSTQTASEYRVKMSNAQDGMQIYCQISNGLGTTISSKIATLSIS